MLAQSSIQLISFVTIAILARLLTPAEIGVFAVASSVAFLAIELRSLGVGQYLIREEVISHEKIRAATGLMMVVSWGLAMIIAIAAPFVADFYDEQALTIIFWIIAGIFILSPFSSVPNALLTRNMQFGELLIVKFFSSIVRSGSSIGFVLLGFSYYGLAMGTFAGAVVEFLLITYFRPVGVPWAPSFSKFKALLKFGLFTSSANTLQKFSYSIPDLVLGRLASMADVGLFSRGLGLVLFLNKLIVQAVGPVLLPHLSSIKRKGGSVADAYLHAIVLQAAFSWPLFAVVNLSAYPMIRAVFGAQWDFAIPIASILAIWAIFQSTHSLSSFALLSVEKEKLMFVKELIIFIARFVAILVAASYGLTVVAWAMVASGLVELVVNTWAIKKALHIEVRHQIISFVPSMIVTAACWGALKFLSYIFDFQVLNPWLSLVIIGVSMLLVWFAALYVTRHEAWGVVSQFVGRIKPIV